MKKFENVYQDAALMRRVLLGEADEAEQQELEKRLEECSDLRKIYEQLQNSETLKAAMGLQRERPSLRQTEGADRRCGAVGLSGGVPAFSLRHGPGLRPLFL